MIYLRAKTATCSSPLLCQVLPGQEFFSTISLCSFQKFFRCLHASTNGLTTASHYVTHDSSSAAYSTQKKQKVQQCLQTKCFLSIAQTLLWLSQCGVQRAMLPGLVFNPGHCQFLNIYWRNSFSDLVSLPSVKQILLCSHSLSSGYGGKGHAWVARNNHHKFSTFSQLSFPGHSLSLAVDGRGHNEQMTWD